MLFTEIQRRDRGVVTLQGSTDGGETYIDFADGSGGANATDGRPAIYSEDIGGVTYTSVIYSTQGVANGAGDGVVVNPESGKSTRTLNAARGNYAPYIPYLEMGDNEQSTGTLDLDQEQLIVAIVPTQGSSSAGNGKSIYNGLGRKRSNNGKWI